jgi:hypothetical protein
MGNTHSGGWLAMLAPLVIKGAMDGPTFLAYVEQALVPKLKRN